VSKLVLDGVSKSFGSFRAVDSFSLQLAEGEFVSLLGPSGCGKTTTLRMIAGFIDPTEGQIAMDGRVLSSPAGATPPEKRRMSMIFQSYAVWPNMTVGENVAFGLKVRKLPREDVARRVDKILDVVHLRPLKERYPAELSGGQQQRVALARAIVIQPEVLLLDEPLSNLDANLREEMRFEIRRLHDEFRITTVYVTHDQGEAMVTSDRIVVMNQGRIEQVDDPSSRASSAGPTSSRAGSRRRWATAPRSIPCGRRTSRCTPGRRKRTAASCCKAASSSAPIWGSAGNTAFCRPRRRRRSASPPCRTRSSRPTRPCGSSSIRPAPSACRQKPDRRRVAAFQRARDGVSPTRGRQSASATAVPSWIAAIRWRGDLQSPIRCVSKPSSSAARSSTARRGVA
jgi:ABC-type proline/glycine betaine transport system ATPase subunit